MSLLLSTKWCQIASKYQNYINLHTHTHTVLLLHFYTHAHPRVCRVAGPPSPYLRHPPQPCSPSYSHDGQSCLCRDKLQHWGQRTPGCARRPLFFIHQTLQGPRCQQLTQLGQHRLRATVIHLEGWGGDGVERERERETQNPV